MKENYYRYLMIVFTLGSFLLLGEGVQAQQELDFMVLATQNPTDLQPRVFKLRDGDPLESGGGFRIKLSSVKEGNLQVKFVESQGGTIVLMKSHDIKVGEELILPDKNNWYSLDKNTGPETIVFEFEDLGGYKHIYKFRIQHINSREIVEEDIKDLVNFPKVVTNQTESKKNKENKLKSISLRGADKLLDQINSSKETSEIQTRGIGSWIYRQYSNSVVFITTDDFGMTGSGFILKNGDIVTNWHVVNGFKKVAVYLKSDLDKEESSREFLVGEIIKFSRSKDLALVRVASYSNKFQSVELGELKDVEIGGDVHAIGHPIGGMFWSYSKGNISGYLRDYEWQMDSGSEFKQNLIQTQTPINPGNSGGPLFNNHGKLIGIMTWMATKKQLMNFAVAIDEIRTFLSLPQTEYNRSQKRKPVVIEYDDLNKDGKRDVVSLDTDHNGIIDKVLFDEDFDGSFETVVLDENENQIIDGVGYDTNQDGYPDMYRLDLNEDKKPDLYGFDDDQDGEIDRYSRR